MRRLFRLIGRLWKKRLLRWAFIGGVGFVIFNMVAIHVTSESWFCGEACHVMGTYYESWKTDVHKEEHVECIDCHIPPGAQNYLMAKINGMGQLVDDLLGRTSGKPSASVSDFACTRSGCHNLDEVLATTKEDGKYLYNHSKHLEETTYLGISTHCTTCHSHVSGEKHFEINTNACIACHLISDEPVSEYAEITGDEGDENTDSGENIPTRQCKKCHNPPSEPFDYQGLEVIHDEYLAYGAACESCHYHVTEDPEEVKDTHCFSCHDFGLERMTDVEELHHEHSAGEHKVECFSCHGVIRHGPIAQAMQLEHFDCRSCHVDQHAIQQDTYEVPGGEPDTQSAEPTDDLPVTPMFLAHVDCTACHIQVTAIDLRPESGATVAKASAEACNSCHKPGFGEQMIPLWQRDTHRLYESVETMLASLTAEDDRTQQAIAEAQGILRIIRVDGSWGAHNPRYTEDLLRRARERLAEVGAVIPPDPVPDETDPSDAEPTPEPDADAEPSPEVVPEPDAEDAP